MPKILKLKSSLDGKPQYNPAYKYEAWAESVFQIQQHLPNEVPILEVCVLIQYFLAFGPHLKSESIFRLLITKDDQLILQILNPHPDKKGYVIDRSQPFSNHNYLAQKRIWTWAFIP